MRGLMGVLALATLLSLPAALPGCGGPQDEVMEYDPELSKKKAAEYEQEMKVAREAAMKNARRGPRGNR